MELMARGLELLVVGMSFVFFALAALYLMMKAIGGIGAAPAGAATPAPATKDTPVADSQDSDLAVVAAAATAVYLRSKRKITVLEKLLPELRDPPSAWGFAGWCENREGSAAPD